MKAAAAATAPAVRRSSTSASSASRQRHAVGRRRGVAQIAGDRAGILDLAATDLACRLLQAVEQGRQVGFDQLAPGRRRAQPPADCALGRDAAQSGDAADIEHVLVDRPADPRRIEIGAAGQHRMRPSQCLSASSRSRDEDSHPYRSCTYDATRTLRVNEELQWRDCPQRKVPRYARDDSGLSQMILDSSSTSWRCSWAVSGFSVSRDTAGPLSSSLVTSRWPSSRQAEQGTACIAGIGTRIDEPTFLQPTHDALHRRLVHADEAAEQVLRELGVLVQLHHAGVLRRRDVGIADRDLEDRRCALMRASQQVADLLFDAVGPWCRT